MAGRTPRTQGLLLLGDDLLRGYIIASGTVPGGSRGTGDNGQLFDGSVTVDYGTAIPAVTPDANDHPVCHDHEVVSRRVEKRHYGCHSGRVFGQRL